MVSNFSFGLVAFSEVNEILVLLAQTSVHSFSFISYYFGLVKTHFESKSLVTHLHCIYVRYIVCT